MSFFSGLWSSTKNLVEEAKSKTTEFTGKIQQKAKKVHEEFLKEKETYTAPEEKVEKHEQLPWEDPDLSAKNQHELKEAILRISMEDNSFLLPPPEEVAFEFQLSLHTKVAMKLLQLDSNLASARHRLVPRKLSESRFWTHYFYRVFVLQDSFRLREEEEREEVERSTGFPEQETFPSPLPRPASPSSPKRSGEMAAEDVVEAKALDYNSEEQPDPSTPEEQESGWDATAIPFPDQAEKAAYQDQVELPELDNLAEGLDQDADMELEGLEGLLDTENDVEIDDELEAKIKRDLGL